MAQRAKTQATRSTEAPRPPRAPAPKAKLNGAQPRRPRLSGPVVTDRDLEIIRWIAQHGLVTPRQVAVHFFHRSDGTDGTWAAYRRLRILEGMGLLQRDHTFWREPQVLRITTAATRFADLPVRPARLVPAQVRHSLAVVDLLEKLQRKSPKGTTLVTERQMRADRRRDVRHGRKDATTGRMPDAELRLPNGARIAVELDLTPKRSADYEDILTSYLRQKYDAVWWYVAPGVVPRLRQIVKDNRSDDLVSVEAWRD